MTTRSPISVFHFDEVEWSAPPASTGASEAMRRGVERKLLAQGEGGYFAQFVSMPADHVVEPHSHDVDELIYLLAGRLTTNTGVSLGVNDSAVLLANQPYGFEVGPDGVQFLLVRSKAAKTKTVT